ncbi:MAG: hypothetical protein M1542_08365 [Thermotogae bacterium]|jgi:hypothetical protein|nr:hypothetical protein [Thermotogota bacterium]
MNEKIQPTSEKQTGNDILDFARDIIHETNITSQKFEKDLLNSFKGEIDSRFDGVNEETRSLQNRITELEKRKKADKIREILYIIAIFSNIILTLLLHFWK